MDNQSLSQNELRVNKKKNKVKKPKRVHKHPLAFKIIGWIFKIFLLGIILGVLAGTVYIYNTLQSVPKITSAMLKTDSSSNMYADDGTTLIWSSAKYKRKYVDIKEVPTTYKNLLLATEDADYYKEKGASIKGIGNAGLSYVRSKIIGGEARGGSGIEQQLIKLSVFSTSADDRTISRKVKELYLATQMDKNFSKSKILEYYINKIWLGENSYGAQTISNTYFGKDLKDLTISQQAIIAGLGQAPGQYNLYNNPKLVEQRRNVVLARGREKHVITKKEYKEAKATPITEGLKPRFWQSNTVGAVTARHNAFVTSALEQIKSLGYDINKTPLQVTTTLNINDENYVKDIFDKHSEYFPSGSQAATTITDPSTGDVLVQIGGRNSNTIGGLNRATNTNRSSGSSIKPILDYGPVYENYNWSSTHAVDASPYRYPGTSITANNYGGENPGMTDARTAIWKSYNTPAIRALEQVGEVRAKQFINKLGIYTNQTLAGSTAISMNVSTQQMAGAIGAFGQEGIYHPTRYVSSLKFSDNSVKKIKFKAVRAMRASTAFVLTKSMEGVFSANGTAAQSHINGVAMAGKTGTNGYPGTSAFAGGAEDLWTVGYTKSASMAVWYGFDQPMKYGNQLNEYADDAAKALLVKNIMTYMNRGKDVSDWSQPSTVKHISGSGLTANYQAIDSPAKTTTTKVLNKVDTTVKSQYPVTFGKKTKGVKPKTPKVPKSYKRGQWQKDLKKEKSEFNSAHKDDLENAKKVGANE